MRHARSAALDELEDLIASLRKLPGLKEKSRGVFYRGSLAFVHFHEDADGLFADVRLRDDFDRFRVSTIIERAVLVKAVRLALRKSG